jgi:hypothetical protein
MLNSENYCLRNTMKSTIMLQIPMVLLQKYYKNTTAVLRAYRLQVTTGHYSHYGHYRFREKVTGFADAVATTNAFWKGLSAIF